MHVTCVYSQYVCDVRGWPLHGHAGVDLRWSAAHGLEFGKLADL